MNASSALGMRLPPVLNDRGGDFGAVPPELTAGVPDGFGQLD
jgi:hypothetical protein